MAILNWSDSYSVSIESIDSQHKVLFDMINEFYKELDKPERGISLIKLIFKLRDYANLHFNKEEQLMKKFNYPDYVNHKNKHIFFMNKVKDYIDRINSGKLLISIEITNFIKEWIVKHIATVDKDYSDFFIKQGVK
jgi:hemerythrin